MSCECLFDDPRSVVSIVDYDFLTDGLSDGIP